MLVFTYMYPLEFLTTTRIRSPFRYNDSIWADSMRKQETLPRHFLNTVTVIVFFPR